jgi:hypothetical protein
MAPLLVRFYRGQVATHGIRFPTKALTALTPERVAVAGLAAARGGLSDAAQRLLDPPPGSQWQDSPSPCLFYSSMNGRYRDAIWRPRSLPPRSRRPPRERCSATER